jgi:site-specific recombinase XerD
MQNNSELVHRENFLLVQEYLAYLLNKKRKNPKTVERYRFWLNHLLLWAMAVPFPRVATIKVEFSDYVKSKQFAKESEKKVVETARAFLRWAKLHHEKKFLCLPSHWVEDLTPTTVDRQSSDRYVSYEEVVKLISKTPGKESIALWRDQAMACLLFLSGARAGAAVSLPIHAVHLDDKYPYVEQKTEFGVQTKNNKSATTYLHNIPELLDFARGWDEFARANFAENHLWYAPIHQQWGEQTTKTLIPGGERSTGLRKRLRLLSSLFGLPYRSPHQYRHGYARYGLERCTTMAEYHALSRNMMHSNIAVTDQIYVHVELKERGQILSRLHQNPVGEFDNEFSAFIEKFSKEDLMNGITILAQRLANL